MVQHIDKVVNEMDGAPFGHTLFFSLYVLRNYFTLKDLFYLTTLCKQIAKTKTACFQCCSYRKTVIEKNTKLTWLKVKNKCTLWSLLNFYIYIYQIITFSD